MTDTAGKGLEGVVVSQTALSFIDGLKGVLVYRGYNIHELAPNAGFLESVYLLWNGKLPVQAELDDFCAELAAKRQLAPETLRGLADVGPDAVPMAALRTGVSLEGIFDPDARDNSPDSNLRKAKRLVARIPTIIAAINRIRQGLDPIPPDPSLSHCADFVRMANGEEGTAEAVAALDRTLLLYLDHGFNASTFACRVIAATMSDMHSAVTGGVGALRGELHGGANMRAMQTLREIGSKDKVGPWLEKAFAEKRRIMGFGHRVYKTEDPRATHLRAMSEVLTQQAGQEDLFQLARELEEQVVRAKGILPNVDYYCATVYHALGIPIDLYTPLFAMGRVGGWTGHVMEQHADNRLIRPRAEYTGPVDLTWTPIDER